MLKLFVVLFVMFAAAQTLAAAEAADTERSVCKDLEQAVCQKREACSWVNGYTTAKGRQVKAFCRRKPARSPARKS